MPGKLGCWVCIAALLCSVGTVCAEAPPGALAIYCFGYGGKTDLSGNGRDAIFGGRATIIGNFLRLGTDGHVEIPGVCEALNGTGPYTIYLKNLITSSVWSPIYSVGQDGRDNALSVFTNYNTLGVDQWYQWGEDLDTSVTLTDNQPHDFFLTYSDGQWTVYDGIHPIGSAGGTYHVPCGTVWIGDCVSPGQKDDFGWYSLWCVVDAIAVYDRALSEAERAELMEYICFFDPLIKFASPGSDALESVSPANIAVVLSNAEEGQTYSVDYAVVGGTAEGGGVDYALEPGTLTFDPGQTGKTISIDIVDDGLDEEDETVIVELSGPTGPNIVMGKVSRHTYTIVDPRPAVAFDHESTETTMEDHGPIEVTVSLSAASVQTVTVDYATTGTATPGVDYDIDPAGLTLTFAPGETSKTITIDPVEDNLREDEETIVLTLYNPTNAKLGSITEHTAVIRDPWASGAFEIFKVDLGCPGGASTLKEGWIGWEVAAGCDGDRHDGRGFSDIAGTGINAYICVEGDSGSGNLRMGSGEPICNTFYSYYSSSDEDVAVELRLSGPGLVAGEYWLYTFHNKGGTPNLSSITATGPGVTQIEPVSNVPVQGVESDDDLVPSLIKFYTEGLDTVTITYHPSGGTNAVVNAFVLCSTIPPSCAADPSPVDGAKNVDPNVVLSWTPARQAASHDVYLGTDYDQVRDANDPNVPPGAGRQAEDSYYAGLLDFETTYYWRIDEVNHAHPESPWTGKIWTFTVMSGKAHNPYPGEGFSNMAVDVNISWTPGVLAAWHDVYFGTDFNDVNEADTSSGAYKGCYELDTNSYNPGPLAKATTYYWRIDELSDATYARGDVWSFATVGILHLKVDLALPQWADTSLVVPGSAKPGWWPYYPARWADMYMHDAVWERNENGEGPPPDTDGIAGSGVHVALGMGGVGNGGFHVYGMCRGSLAGDLPPSGTPLADPIANGWYHNVDWGGEATGDILMRINAMPPGEYELVSYHNHWEPRTQSTRNCLTEISQMPNMPSVTAMPLPAEPLPHYAGWNFTPGTGIGVEMIEGAYDVDVTSVTSDDEVSTSVIKFRTDGNDVLVIYDGGTNDYPDPARPGREGSKAILNAFEVKLVKPANTAPVADAGRDRTVYAWSNGKAHVILDGSGSYDDDGDELTYLWSWTIGTVTITTSGRTPSIILPVGTHVIELVVNDGTVDSEPDTVVITVVPAIETTMKFTPQSLNCASKGNWVKAHFVLPEPIRPEDINTAVPIVAQIDGWEGMVPSERTGFSSSDDGSPVLTAAFDRAAFCAAAPDNPLAAISVTVTGSLATGRHFYGTDTIKIANSNLKHLDAFVSDWLETGCGKPDWCAGRDINRDWVVNFRDYVILAAGWLEGIE